MPLAVKTRLGPYEILAPLGSGGMGEVYRARDTRLDRTVAIKVLPPHATGREDLRERFEREARVVSSLNHPHICTLYDIGRQDGIDFLVMECVEGETLETRLRKGALPLSQALEYAIQIADALDQAHHKGVIHRDLKPGNIMLTHGGIKLLDFGLAKLSEPVRTEMATLLSTETRPLTAEGAILGTFQYMSPEQLEAQEADTRSDIFSFGCVLYEMLSGRRAFEGQSRASLIAAVLTAEPPPPSTLAPVTPPALDRVVRKCLAKKQDDRWQTARDLKDELQWISEGGGVAAPLTPARRAMAWIAISAVLALLTIALVLAWLLRPPPHTDLMRFTLNTLDGTNMDLPAVSPDGTRVVFRAPDRSGKTVLWLRPLDSSDPQPIPGTEDGYSPFWSPDGASIGFAAGDKLKRLRLGSAAPQTICAIEHLMSASWSRYGVILLTPTNRESLFQVPAAGGVATRLTQLDRSLAENSHRWAHFLPDGRRFLYLARSGDPQNTAIYAASLDSPQRKRVLTVQSTFAYAEPGYLLYVREGVLFAQAFNARKPELTGEALPIANHVMYSAPSSLAPFSASLDGRVLVFHSGGSTQRQLTWFDRSGNRLGVVGQPGGDFMQVRISPDGKRAVLTQPDSRTGNRDLWVMDLERGVLSQLTTNPANDWGPVWSPDGSRIAFSSDPTGRSAIFVKAANGGAEELIAQSDRSSLWPNDWSPDGHWLVFHDHSPNRFLALGVLKIDGDRKPHDLPASGYAEYGARFSPDGQMLAYHANEPGGPEIYIRSFVNGNTTGAKWRVSKDGGVDPVWSHDGKELFYLNRDGQFVSVEIRGETALQAGATKLLFKPCDTAYALFNPARYDTAADGKRFLVACPAQQTDPPRSIAVVNWQRELKK